MSLINLSLATKVFTLLAKETAKALRKSSTSPIYDPGVL